MRKVFSCLTMTACTTTTTLCLARFKYKCYADNDHDHDNNNNDNHYSCIIVGGGWSGIGAAASLKANNVTDYIILEKGNCFGYFGQSYMIISE